MSRLMPDRLPSSPAPSRALMTLRKHMLKGVRDAARPLQVKLRESVRGLDSSAKSSGGHVSRGAYSLRGHKGTAASVLIASGLAAKAAGRSGLRDSIARSIRIVAKDSGYGDQVGVRVAQHGGLPPISAVYPGTWIGAGGVTPSWVTGTSGSFRPSPRRAGGQTPSATTAPKSSSTFRRKSTQQWINSPHLSLPRPN